MGRKMNDFPAVLQAVDKMVPVRAQKKLKTLGLEDMALLFRK